MKAIILAGGLGTRLAEETQLRPKPMVEIGGIPILVHIMNHLSKEGISDFIILAGYKNEVIKHYFLNYDLINSDFTVTLSTGTVEVLRRRSKPWRVTILDTGPLTQTGGRLLQAKDHVSGQFLLTYGDGISDISVAALLASHNESKAIATVTAVRPPARFGSIEYDPSSKQVTGFKEKIITGENRVSGGYFIFEQQIFDYLHGEPCILEQGPLQKLAETGKLNAYLHDGYWAAMDTVRDKNQLENIWLSGKAPWL